jgi:hypothetical protein
MSTRPPVQCLNCTHWASPLDRTDPDALTDAPTQVCAAFPLEQGGIPDQIWTGRADHRQPFEGDNGIRFEAAPGETFPEYALVQGG